MNQSIISRWVFIPLIIVLVQSCCRDKNPYKDGCQKEPFTYMGDYPLGEIRDYLYFQPGSMWVYECDSTLELDTQIMQSCNIEAFQKPYITYELLTFTKKSINEGSTYKVYYPTKDIPYNEERNHLFSTVITRSNPIDPQVSTDCIFFHPFDDSKFGFGSSPTYYRGYLDSLTVLGTQYNDIRIFEVQHSAGFAEPNLGTTQTGQATYYWAKNVGIIRLHVWTAKRSTQETLKYNWNLKEYNVSQ